MTRLSATALRLTDNLTLFRHGTGEFPAELLVRHIQETGRHFLAPELLSTIEKLRERTMTPPVAELVNCVLAKVDGRFDYRSYLALPLVDFVGARTPGGAAHLAPLLLTDLVRFERRAWHEDRRMTARRPDTDRTRRRLRHALRLVEKLSTRETSNAKPTTQLDDIGEQALRCSVLPTSVEHDEYLFIRVIQTYEVIFTEIERDLDRAMASAIAGDAAAVADLVDKTARVLDGSAGLFSLLATMCPDAFREFRDFTVGAGAIQSRSYKRIELLCGPPKPSRRDSAAFRSVPEVREEVFAEPDSLSAWYLRDADRMTSPERARVDSAFAHLEAVHQRWKRTHHTLAAAMIGERRGSAHTEGVSYLAACEDNRLFWPIGDRYSHLVAHRDWSQ